MPINTFYDDKTNLLRIVSDGVVSLEDRSRSIDLILVNSQYSGESDILIDVSGITNPPNGEDFMGVANLVKLLRSRFNGRIAILNSQAGHLTVCQLIALSVDFSRDYVRVFYLEEEALAWFKE